MSQDPIDQYPTDAAPPSLRKASPSPEPVPGAPEPSIWEPLDGSAPRLPAIPPPATGAWGQPHQGGVVPPHDQVAAAYANAQSAGVFTLAGWGPRFGAFLLDSILFGLVIVVALLPIGLAFGLTVNEASLFFATATVPESVVHPEALYAMFVVGRLLIGIIPAVFLVRWAGQTPGKRALGIRVMPGGGGPMTMAVALRRELLGRAILLQIVTLATFGLAAVLNYLWPLWDPQRRAGHDLLANTRVVTAPKS